MYEEEFYFLTNRKSAGCQCAMCEVRERNTSGKLIETTNCEFVFNLLIYIYIKYLMQQTTLFLHTFYRI